MALSTPVSHSKLVPSGFVHVSARKGHILAGGLKVGRSLLGHPRRMSRVMVVKAAVAAEKPSKKRYPGEAKGFVEEMRFVAMKLHTKDQAKEGKKEADANPVGKWEPTVEGYLKFLVDSKLVYDTLEKIVDKAAYPFCKLVLMIFLCLSC